MNFALILSFNSLVHSAGIFLFLMVIADLIARVGHLYRSAFKRPSEQCVANSCQQRSSAESEGTVSDCVEPRAA
jgi:hypothetical protein